MSEHTAELQHMMQSMTDLIELTPDLILALSILQSLSSDHSQLIEQIKAMDLKDFTAMKIIHLVNEAEKLKFAVAAVTGMK